MKLAKKVLSVVLAVVLALSAFAVIGSANGNPDADYQVKIWLTAQQGTAEWSSNSKVNIAEIGDESDAGATLEVQPGETYFIRFYCTTNYYVGMFQTNVFYSAALRDAGEEYALQRGRAITAANVKKINLWNTDSNYWVGLQGTAYSAQNTTVLQAEGFNTDVAQNWPTDDAGNNLFNMNEWQFNRFNNLATEASGETCIWEEEEHLFMMPVTVPEDAQPGDTFYVTIPEGLEQRSAKQFGALRVTEIGIADGESEPNDIVDATAQTQPNMQYGDENQYYDLSGATITLQVPGAASVDTAALEAKIAEAAGLLDDGLTAGSIAALNDAITAGNAALTSNDQAVIDAAVEDLEAAIAAAEALANYTALNNAIARYEALDAADWDDASFAAATAKYEDAKAIAAGLGVSAQGTIDAAAAALNTAIDNLAVALDYSALNAKIAEVKDTDTSIYTDATAGAFNAALAAAQSLVANSQAEIDKALADLTAAFDALAEKAADYTALDAAISAFDAVDAKAWTADSYAAAKAKYDAAKAVARDLKITAQATVDAAAEALDAAIDALVPAAGANYAALDAAIADAKALVADNYVSFAGVTAALANAEAVARDLTANDQAIIDEAAAALNAAIAALVEAEADYSKVNAAISAADAILNKKDGGVNSYSDATLEAINAAKATVVTGLKKKDQAQVDEMAAAINAAIASAEFRAWDYTAINDHIAAIEAKDVKYYDAASYADYLAKKAALVMDYTYENYAKAMLQQINFLKVNPVAAAAADYTDVDDAIAAFRAKIAAADYEQDGIDAVEAIIADIDRTLNANDQAIVDQYAADIIAATAALVEIIPAEPADYSALDKAIEAAKTLEANEFVDFAGVAAALADAEAVARDLTIDDQAIVDAAADALNAAMGALELKADYAALDAALADAAALNKNAWTADTWAALEAAVADGKAISRNLGVSAQATIDAAAEAITAAIAALEAKEVTSSIMEVIYEKSEDTHNTFDVKVEGRAAMVQFIEMDGGTRTYDRYNKNVTIVSYNANNEVVNSLSRDVAYEIWTINTNLIGPDVKMRAKYLEGNQYIWETEKYSFTLELIEPTFDADIREITPVAESGKKGAVKTTVVVGPDAEGVRFVMDNGTTTTYYAEKATVLDNGDLSFTGSAWANHDGLNTIIVKVRVNGAWVEMGTFDYTVE